MINAYFIISCGFVYQAQWYNYIVAISDVLVRVGILFCIHPDNMWLTIGRCYSCVWLTSWPEKYVTGRVIIIGLGQATDSRAWISGRYWLLSLSIIGYASIGMKPCSSNRKFTIEWPHDWPLVRWLVNVLYQNHWCVWWLLPCRSQCYKHISWIKKL